MSDVVYAKTDCVVVWSGGQSPISKGDVWDSEADLVRERPDLFSTEPTRVRGQKARPETPPVERATAAPGEKRATRRKTTR